MRAALAALAFLASVAAGPVRAQPACPALPASTAPLVETTPAPMPIPHWQERVQELEDSLARDEISAVRLLFLGDSITQSWTPRLFQQFYAHRSAFNMGVSSDTTQSLLWRLARSPLGKTLRPEVVVLMIGTNNAPNHRPEHVAQGVAENVRLILQRSPASRVILLGLTPRGAKAQDPLRGALERINALLARCADDRQVFWADPGSMLLDGAGNLSDLMAPDRLHLSPLGYAVVAAGMEAQIRALMPR
jgi:beta-glucosidase